MKQLKKKYLKIFFLTFMFTILVFAIHLFAHIVIYEKTDVPIVFSTSFEVIPENNQWAYDAVEKLIRAGLIEGDISEEEMEGIPTLQLNSNFNLDIIEKNNKIYGLLISPLINLIIGYMALFIYIKKKKLWIWVLAIGSQMRILHSLYQVIFINHDIDEIIASYYLGLPSFTIYIASIIVSGYCIILLFKNFTYQNESIDILVLTTVLGSGFAFVVLEIIRQVYVNTLIYFR